ncbi:MAG: hypothetical protein C0602_05790 [Denitrovibrio sp.]|nr:MAG: hypothetical protein C0602_05790 [Denitrovibrio sp.]
MSRKPVYNNKAVVTHSNHKFKCKISNTEALEAMGILKPNAFKLLIYYYTRSTNWEFNDAEIAEKLNIKPSTVPILRNELIKAGYLLIKKGKIHNYFIGKKAIENWLKNRTNPEAINQLKNVPV